MRIANYPATDDVHFVNTCIDKHLLTVETFLCCWGSSIFIKLNVLIQLHPLNYFCNLSRLLLCVSRNISADKIYSDFELLLHKTQSRLHQLDCRCFFNDIIFIF